MDTALNPTPPLHIRPAQHGDAELLLSLITELAAYEKAEHEVISTVADIEQKLLTPGAAARALICMRGDEAIGYAVYFFSYSTWLGCNGLYLEDLYITPRHRSSGAGRQTLRHLAQLAVQQQCGRFEWSVLDWNEPAIQFYQSLGAQAQGEWVRYRLAGTQLHAFAQGQNQ
jgi:GNAT superfamily N-acetyltransferase